MRKSLGSTIIALFLLVSISSVHAQQPGVDPEWRTTFKNTLAKTDLTAAIAEAYNTCVPTEALVKAAIEEGQDPYQVVKLGISPGTCAGGCACGVIRGAVQAGVSQEVISKAAADIGADAAVVTKGLASGGKPNSAWEATLKKSLNENGDLEKAISEPINACVAPGEVVKAAIKLGQDPSLVLMAAIKAAGGGCLCDAVIAAYDVGVPAKVIEKAAYDACACALPVATAAPVPAPPPAPAPERIVRERIILRGINFDYDRYTIKPEFVPILDEVAALLKARPELKVMVEGHACAMGTDVYNQRLSERRAKAVRDYLIKKSIPAAQMQPVGFGEAKPFADNDTEEGRRLNRRVEFKLID